MSTKKQSLFQSREIQPIERGEIREAESESEREQTRGLSLSGSDSEFSSSEEIIEAIGKLFSDNTYKNELTKQRFEFKISCEGKDRHEKLQETMRVAARVEALNPNSQIDQESGRDDESGIEEEEQLVVDAREIDGHNGESSSDDVEITLIVKDSVGIEPPYRVHFLLIPDADKQAEMEAQNDGVGRGTVQQQIFDRSFDLHLPLCEEPLLFVEDITLNPQHSAVSARLSWSNGSLPENGENGIRQYHSVGQTPLPFTSPKITADRYTLSVKLVGTGEYMIEGDYVDVPQF